MSRKLTLKGAKKKAWDAQAKYLVAKWKKCVLCKSTNQLQASHFHHNVLDFDPINIHPTCKHCNHFLSGNLNVYAEFLLKTYGLKEFNALSKRRYQALKGEKRTIEEYLELEEHYKKLLNETPTNKP